SSSGWPSISADGRYITFASWASDLVQGDTNGEADLFVWDHKTGTVTRFTNGYNGSGQPAISADGRYIAFECSVTMTPPIFFSQREVFMWDRSTGITTRITNG